MLHRRWYSVLSFVPFAIGDALDVSFGFGATESSV